MPDQETEPQSVLLQTIRVHPGSSKPQTHLQYVNFVPCLFVINHHVFGLFVCLFVVNPHIFGSVYRLIFKYPLTRKKSLVHKFHFQTHSGNDLFSSYIIFSLLNWGLLTGVDKFNSGRVSNLTKNWTGAACTCGIAGNGSRALQAIFSDHLDRGSTGQTVILILIKQLKVLSGYCLLLKEVIDISCLSSDSSLS